VAVQFPVWIPLGGFAVHPHILFESLAYFIGFWVYRHLRQRNGDPIEATHRWTIVAAAAVGAALGSKLLFWLIDPAATWAHRFDPEFLMGGKTIVGGLLGGLLAVEAIKRRIGITRSTGDLFAVPLAIGIAIGRIGCFLTGLPDRTYGDATSLPWGIDFGDGIARHPTQVYEIYGLILLAAWLSMQSFPRPGDRFKAFLCAYMAMRFLLAFIQPGVTFVGLTTIQWAALVTLAVYARHFPRILPFRRPVHA
jgi:phosphatidylglycerol---prolipoprotein diacylglyceryl transferase